MSAGAVVNFANGTLNTGGLLTRLTNLHGSGTINTHGLVSDLALVFDQSHGLSNSLLLRIVQRTKL